MDLLWTPNRCQWWCLRGRQREEERGRESKRKKLKSIVLRHKSEYLVSLETALFPSHIHFFQAVLDAALVIMGDPGSRAMSDVT